MCACKESINFLIDTLTADAIAAERQVVDSCLATSKSITVAVAAGWRHISEWRSRDTGKAID